MHTDRSRGAPDAVDADVRASADAVPALPAAAPMEEIMEIMRTHGAVSALVVCHLGDLGALSFLVTR